MNLPNYIIFTSQEEADLFFDYLLMISPEIECDSFITENDEICAVFYKNSHKELEIDQYIENLIKELGIKEESSVEKKNLNPIVSPPNIKKTKAKYKECYSCGKKIKNCSCC